MSTRSNTATPSPAKTRPHRADTVPPSTATDVTEIDAMLGRSRECAPLDPTTALQLAREALRLAREIGNVGLEAEAHLKCAQGWFHLGNGADQAACCDAALELVERIDDPLRKARVLQELGRDRDFHRGDLRAALRLHRAALAIFKDLKEPGPIALTIDSIGLVYRQQGRYSLCLKYFFRALRIRTDAGDTRNIAGSLLHIGNIYAEIEDFDTALDHFHRALDLSRSLDDTRMTAGILSSMGTCYCEIDRPAEGLPLLLQSLELLTATGARTGIVGTISNIGGAYEYLNDFSKALEFQKRALAEAEKQSHPAVLLSIFCSIGRLHQRRGDYYNALAYYARGIEVSNQAPVLSEINLHAHLAELYTLIHDYRQALEHYRTGETIRETILNPGQLRAIAAVAADHAERSAGRKRKNLLRRVEQVEHEASERAHELNALLLNLTRRDQALKTIQGFLKPLSSEARGKTREIAKKILGDINAALDIHTECRPVEEQFEQVHREFIHRLCRRCGSLTPTEIRICVLIRLNLSIKQIADTLFSSEETVKTHRKRIRRKLELTDENLSSFLISL